MLYSGDLNTYNLNTELFEVQISNGLVFKRFGIQTVWYSNGQFKCYVLCTRPTIQIPDQYIRKQDSIHLSGFQMVGLSGIQMAFENQTILHPTSFQPFKFQTSLEFRSPL